MDQQIKVQTLIPGPKKENEIMKKNLSILKILEIQETLASTWGIADRCSEMWKAKGLAKFIYIPSLLSEILDVIFKLDDGIDGFFQTLGYRPTSTEEERLLSLLIRLDPWHVGEYSFC